MKDRIKQIRKRYNLTQEEFGARLGLTKSAISRAENGSIQPQEQTLRLICREFNVSYPWLKDGVGEMLSPPQPDRVDQIVAQYSFPDIVARMLRAFDSLSPDQQRAVLLYAQRFIAALRETDSAAVAAAIASPPHPEAASRQALANRLLRETSSSSPPGETNAG